MSDIFIRKYIKMWIVGHISIHVSMSFSVIGAVRSASRKRVFKSVVSFSNV